MREAPRAARDEQELLALYAQGVRNFAGTQLSGADLREADLTEVSFDRAQLGGADLSNATLIEASLEQARLTRAVLRGAKLWAANLAHVNLVGGDLSGASLVSANLKGADAREAKLNGVNLSGANLFKANLLGAQLVGADLGRANLPGANLSGVLAMEADFTSARLWQTGLQEADLRNARLGGASLIGARLDRADLAGATLAGADLSDASLVGARVDALPDSVAAATGCRIDVETYARSSWDPFTLSAWIDAGAILVEAEAFPREALDHLASRGEGLTIYLRTPIEPFDRFLVDALIFGVLGATATCSAVEVVALEARGIIRLMDERQANLAAVGAILFDRRWSDANSVAIQGLFEVPELARAAERFRDRLDRMELRGLGGERRLPAAAGAADPFLGDKTRVERAPDDLSDRPLTTIQVWHADRQT